ncbi:MAG: HAMP domain-containing histidine kinase [Thaumarchaeota archaeon]|nr:HAMP domain-containing histidine kinase [Nitrososphaerota archaeon]MBI3639172.1 HAMP domain-containing histidine kinase [Nitrososphaerota archaeon]
MTLHIIDTLLQLQSQKINLIFFIVMLGGSIIILLSFYLINIDSLVNDTFLPVKYKVMGIGIFIVIVHILLTYVVRLIFNKLQHAKTMICKQNEELRKIDKAKSEFIAMVTHDLKTPIVPIASYSRMLIQERFGELNDKQKEKLKVIISSTESLQNLISDIHDLHKADLDKLKLNLESVDVNEIVRQSIETVLPLANRRGVIFEDLTTPGLEINVDKQRMIQVVTNLIKNAIDFVPVEEGVIRMECQLQDNNMTLSIVDNGIGIPKEKISNLFNRFCQLDSSNNGGRSSSGLGLYICKVIIEQHGGKIWAESEVGKGTSMKISLPMTPSIDLADHSQTKKQFEVCNTESQLI